MVSGSRRLSQEKLRPFVIPIFLPHAGCPHQCVFCNQTSITGIKKNKLTAENVRGQVEAFLKYNRKQREPVQIAFFGGNFLGQAPGVVKVLLAEATRFVHQGRVDSIRFSTRPDTIDRRRLEALNGFPVSTIEIGVQSMNKRVLTTSRRGHSDLDTEQAVGLLKDSHYTIGVQIMIGLPGEDPDTMMQTGQRIVNLKPDFVRIYPTLVIQGSPLAKWYQKGKYRPLPLKTAVTRVKNLYLLFQDAQIPVIRMGLQHTEEFDNPETILAGPYHPAFGHLVYSEIFLDRVRRFMESDKIRKESIDIRVHPKNVSRVRGLNNENIKKLIELYCLKSVSIIPDPGIAKNKFMINARLISTYD